MPPSPSDTRVKLMQDLASIRVGEDASPMEKAAEVIRVMAKSPPPLPPPPTGPESDFGKTRCACGKIVDPERIKIIHTGVLNAVEGLCPDCEPNYAGTARIVCCACKTVVGRMVPHDAGGFKFSADKCYHIERCVFCDPSVESATIIELAIWQGRHKKAVDTVTKQPKH